MSTEPTTSRGVRLPDTLWEAIANEAHALQMSPAEFIRRRLLGAVSCTVLCDFCSLRDTEERMAYVRLGKVSK